MEASDELTRVIAESKLELETLIPSQLEVIRNIFPDSDPDFLDEKLKQCTALEGDAKKFDTFIDEMLSITKYPTMSDYLQRQNEVTQTETPPRRGAAAENDQGEIIHSKFLCSICLEEKDTVTGSCNSPVKEHIYCITCVERYVKQEMTEGRAKFNCMESSCKAEFSEKVLRKILDSSTLNNVSEQRQHEEIMAANIPDLECCPFCNFKVIISNTEEKIFKCLNPKCMVDSCRLCKEKSHIPLKCKETESDCQQTARKRLENKMSEAMIRVCPNCQKRFIKSQGCNHVTCSCGANICYYCKQLMDSYHYKYSPRCQQMSNEEIIHAQEVRQAAIKGKQEMDPNIKLLHDPTVGIL